GLDAAVAPRNAGRQPLWLESFPGVESRPDNGQGDERCQDPDLGSAPLGAGSLGHEHQALSFKAGSSLRRTKRERLGGIQIEIRREVEQKLSGSLSDSYPSH